MKRSLVKRLTSAANKSMRVAILSGGMIFAGSVASADVILQEDFEAGDGGTWGGGAGQFGTYDSNQNFSGDPHSNVPNGGSFYGNLIGSQGANPLDGPLVSAAIDFSASDVDAISAGLATLQFDGWLASWTGDNNVAVFTAELFDATGGGGSSLGVITLANGAITNGDVGWTEDNWSRYISNTAINPSARSITITYGGPGNDTYADNIDIRVSSVTVPEPASMTLLGLAGFSWFVCRRRN